MKFPDGLSEGMQLAANELPATGEEQISLSRRSYTSAPPIVVTIDGFGPAREAAWLSRNYLLNLSSYMLILSNYMPNPDRKKSVLKPEVVSAWGGTALAVSGDDVVWVPWSGVLFDTKSAIEKAANLIVESYHQARDQDRQIIVIGHSWGGVIAYHALRLSSQAGRLPPNSVGHLVTLCSPINNKDITIYPFAHGWVGFSDAPQSALMWRNYHVDRDLFSSDVPLLGDKNVSLRYPPSVAFAVTAGSTPLREVDHVDHAAGCRSFLRCIGEDLLMDLQHQEEEHLEFSVIPTVSSSAPRTTSRCISPDPRTLDALVTPLPHATKNGNDCDTFALHPLDREVGLPGVALENIDVPSARAACERAVREHPKVGRFRYNFARVLLAQGDLAGFERQLTAAAQAGYTLAQVYLGYALLGQQTPLARLDPLIQLPRDDNRAVRLFMEAALRDDLYGQAMLGWLFATGRGLQKSDAMARIWWERAAANRDDRYENVRVYAEERLAELNAAGQGRR